MGTLITLCSALIQKSVNGGLAVAGGLNLSGSIETIVNPIAIVENAIEKGAVSVLMPISSRRQLNDLPDDSDLSRAVMLIRHQPILPL